MAYRAAGRRGATRIAVSAGPCWPFAGLRPPGHGQPAGCAPWATWLSKRRAGAGGAQPPAGAVNVSVSANHDSGHRKPAAGVIMSAYRIGWLRSLAGAGAGLALLGAALTPASA